MLGTGLALLVLALIIAIATAAVIKRRKRRSPGLDDSHPGTVDNPGELSSPQRNIPRDEHPVSRKEISENALKVLHRLNSNGFDAYLVGGCIRDIYLGLHPKDFDVATNATPEQVRQLFRNSRVIGRRFKLVHILFGREMIEVATFRASHDQDNHGRDKSRHSDSGRILRDNVYGSMEEDALRRDFTINALYYTSTDHSVVDYCNGISDIQQRTLRLIGDPVRRYHEDPVRMLRAIRFQAKLDFQVEEATAAPIFELGHLLKDIPSARMFDEILKLLQSGQGESTFDLLRDYDLFAHIFPATQHCLDSADDNCEALLRSALRSTDQRVGQDKPVTPAFLFAALLWSPLQRLAKDLREQGVPPVPALQQAAMTVIENQCAHTAIPRRFSMTIRDIWDLQFRLERRQPKTIDTLLTHPKFRAAYDFLVLREESGEPLNGAGQWWTELQEGMDSDRDAMIQSLRGQRREQAPGERPRRRRRRPRRRPAPNRNSQQ